MWVAPEMFQRVPRYHQVNRLGAALVSELHRRRLDCEQTTVEGSVVVDAEDQPVARIVSERGRIVWEGDPRHRIILQTRRVWRRAMIESTKRSEMQPEAAELLGELPA